MQTALNKGVVPSIPVNMIDKELIALRSLSRCNGSVIKPADKGSIVLILSREAYEAEVQRQLSVAAYEKLPKNPTKRNNETLRLMVKNLFNKGIMNRKTAMDLIEPHPRPARFYILPNIHKSLAAYPGRPIVSSNNCPTERISAYLKYVNSLRKPLVKELPSFAKNTKH